VYDQGVIIMRRCLLSLFAVVCLLTLGAASVLAQEASPAATPAGGSPFADLGLPELDITVSHDGYAGIPDTLDAGRYLVTVTATQDTADFGGGGVAFVQPAGMSGQEFIDFLGQLQGPPDESGVGVAAATPIEGGIASPAAGSGEQGAPDFYYQSKLAGGSYSGPGQTTEVVLDLTPGEWVAWGDDPEAPYQPVAFTVTGEMPTNLTEPQADVTITLGEYVINVTEGELTAGSHIIRVDNVGAQPHFVFGAHAPEGITNADIEAILQADMSGTPAATEYNPETDFQDIFGTGTQSMGTSQWIYVPDIPAGPLVMLCFFPDQADGLPHALHGMYTIVEVGQ
jgi:hypothetical protein